MLLDSKRAIVRGRKEGGAGWVEVEKGRMLGKGSGRRRVDNPSKGVPNYDVSRGHPA